MKKYVFLGLILFTAVTLFGCGEKTTAISNPTDTSTASKSIINDNTDSESTISNSAESSSQPPASSLASSEAEESNGAKNPSTGAKDLNNGDFQRYWANDDFFDLKAYAKDHGYEYQCIVVQAGFDDDGNLITLHNAVLESMDKDARLILALNGFSVGHVSGGGFGRFEFKKDPRNIKVDYDDEKLLIQDDVIFALPEIISLLDDTKGKKDMLKGSRFESGFEPGFFESN